MMSETIDKRDDAPEQPGRRSGAMAFSALLTLLVAAWCLADGPEFSVRGAPWLLLAAGVAVGVGLIASGFRRG